MSKRLEQIKATIQETERILDQKVNELGMTGAHRAMQTEGLSILVAQGRVQLQLLAHMAQTLELIDGSLQTLIEEEE